MMAILWRILVVEAVMGTILFGSAGRWDLPWFWAVLATHTLFLMVGMALIDPDLRRERMHPGPGGRARSFKPIAMLLIVAHLVVAGLDVGRHGWSGPIPIVARAAAMVGYALALGFSFWAMRANPFFSPNVRIQRDRGQKVVTDGPYRFIRHPGYAGMLIAASCGGIALGSWWSLLPLLPFALLVLARTVIEDRMLQLELEGYTGYAHRVRYRLVPGIW